MLNDRRWISVVAVIGLLGSPVMGADVGAPKPTLEVTAPAAPRSDWQFQFTHYSWVMFVIGDQTIGNTTSSGDTNMFQILGR